MVSKCTVTYVKLVISRGLDVQNNQHSLLDVHFKDAARLSQYDKNCSRVHATCPHRLLSRIFETRRSVETVSQVSPI